MKNISLILNGVLLIAVAILFYLHFSTVGASNGAASGNDSTPNLKLNLSATQASRKILYINPDTINKYYEPIANKNKEIEQQVAAYQNSLDAKQRLYEKNLSDAEQLYQQGKISEAQMPEIQAGLQKLERDYMMSKSSFEVYQKKVMQDQNKMMADVTAYFKEYSQKNGLDYILYSTSLIAYGNDSLDISKEMTKALNEAYKAKLAKEKENPAPKKK